MFTNHVTRYSPPKQVFEDSYIHYFSYCGIQVCPTQFMEGRVSCGPQLKRVWSPQCGEVWQRLWGWGMQLGLNFWGDMRAMLLLTMLPLLHFISGRGMVTPTFTVNFPFLVILRESPHTGPEGENPVQLGECHLFSREVWC